MIPAGTIRAMFATYLRNSRDGDGKAAVQDYLKRYPEDRTRLLHLVTDALRGFNE